ncbi:DUF1003 domain-containing protein [Thermithiobacillus tepidarius DSM 3134]|uniref:DUF1003 domain-containing protein n=1 Tax=Thermithiobacillus tepidarius TaxID=929 RepID=UPI00042694E8|nr:DUF1003 domain-containing protein [Thermithiobacillus tepidarius]
MDDKTPASAQSELADVVERNISTLLARRRAEERRKGMQERIADAITRFTGSMRFVYIHLVVYGLWIAINLGWLPFIPKFDASFVKLAMVASVEAIFLSTFVLISQNRMAALADKRADLDLQISLLAEHEITRLIQLVTAMAERMGVEESKNPELDELAQDVAPEAVLDKMDETRQRFESAEWSKGKRRRREESSQD